MNHNQIEQTILSPQEEMFQNGLEAIRTEFRLTLAEKLSEIERCMRAIEANDNAQKALTGLSETAHKFRGAATTLGFSALGTAAGAVEDCISDIRESTGDAGEMAQKFVESYQTLVMEVSALV
jgi:HPt (histidine-containing phosphotransfer) domain-containing protein